MPTNRTLQARRNAVALAALLMFQPISQGAIPAFYTVTPLLSPIGDPIGVYGVALNDVGAVAGSDGNLPFLWNGTGRISHLTDSGAQIPDMGVSGLNNSGVVVGSASTRMEDGRSAVVAVRWQSGALTLLSPRDAQGLQTSGFGWGINDQGWIVGTNATVGGPTGNVNTGMLWSPTNQPTSFGTGFAPAAINNQNTVAGASVVAGVSRPALWTPGGGLRELPLPGGTQGVVNAINELGQAIGTYRQGDGDGMPIRWDAQGRVQTLGLPQGALRSFATGINDQGLAVGSSVYIDNSHGFGYPFDGRADPLLWDAGATAPVNLANLARMPNGGTLADAGLWWTEAVDINARGQVLVNGFRFYTDYLHQPNLSGWESFVLSPCTRCGQILPNPNPGGSLLDIGADWVDAYNELAFDNFGALALRTVLVNRANGSLRNAGNLNVFTDGSLLNHGLLVNEQGGQLNLQGQFDNRSGSVINRSAVRMLEGADVHIAGSEGFVNQSGSRFTQEGGSLRNDSLFSIEGALFDQQAGSFENGAGATFRLWGGDAVIGGSLTNAGTVLIAADPLAPIGSPNRPSQVRISGTLDNLANAAITAEGGSLIDVAGGQLVNRGALTLEAGSTRLTVRSGGSLHNDGGTIRLGAGSLLRIEQDAGSPQQQSAGPLLLPPGPGPGGVGSFRQMSGTLFVAHGARVEIDPTRGMDVIGGRVSNEGVIVARSAARITNSGNFQLQTGSRLELDGGASFEQGAGELLIAAGAEILGAGLLNHFGGTTTVNGSISLPLSVFSGGVLAGTGVIFGNVVLAGALDLRPGNSPGTLTIDGDLTIDDSVTLHLEVADYRSFDRLVVSGNVGITSLRVAFTPTGGYQPDLNDSFQWLQAGQSITGLENVVFDNAMAGWELQADPTGRIGLWNVDAVELPEGGVTSFEVAAGRLTYLSPLRAGAGYEVAGNLWISGSLAVQPQAVMNVRGALTVAADGRLSNRGQIELFQGLHNQGRVENRDDAVLLLRGGATLRNEGVLVNSGRLTSEGQVVNAAGARFENHGVMTTPQLRNDGHFIVRGSLVTTEGVNNFGRFEIGRGGRVDAGGGYIQFVNGPAAPVTRVDGDLMATNGTISIDEGVLEGSGHIQGLLQLGGGVPPSGPKALVRPGGSDAVGTLTADGMQVVRADFEIDIASSQSFDQLVTQGLTVSDGQVHFRLLDGFVPAAGSQFTWLSTDPANVPGSGLAAMTWTVSLVRTDQSVWLLGGSSGWDPAAPLRFTFDGVQLTVTAVPEPGTTAMLLLGLMSVAGWRLRKPPASAGQQRL